MSQVTCSYCFTLLANKYILKTHQSTNKACLATRNIELKTDYQCEGCQLFFLDQNRLALHHESCKVYQVLIAREETKKEYLNKMNDLEKQQQLNLHHFEQQYQLNITEIKHSYEMIIKEKDARIYQLEDTIKNMKDSHESNMNRVSSIYNHAMETLQTYNNTTIDGISNANGKTLESIKHMVSEVISRPTTTTNHVNATIRNVFSSEYTVDNIKPEDIKRKCEAYLTEQLFFEGQRGIAKLCSDHIIKTKDNKQLLTCTDTSRKKFKHMDEHGNIKEDMEARNFLEKVSKPIKEVSKVIYESIISDVEFEQEQLQQEEEIDYSRKSLLSEKYVRAGTCFMDISNIDNMDMNREFTAELAKLTK